MPCLPTSPTAAGGTLKAIFQRAVLALQSRTAKGSDSQATRVVKRNGRAEVISTAVSVNRYEKNQQRSVCSEKHVHSLRQGWRQFRFLRTLVIPNAAQLRRDTELARVDSLGSSHTSVACRQLCCSHPPSPTLTIGSSPQAEVSDLGFAELHGHMRCREAQQVSLRTVDCDTNARPTHVVCV